MSKQVQIANMSHFQYIFINIFNHYNKNFQIYALLKTNDEITIKFLSI